MSVEITKVKYYPELRRIAAIADEIWHECYGELLGQGQVDYMVEKFQSIDAMTEQIEFQNYNYLSVCENGKLCGYIGIKPEDCDRLFLSKFYLHKEYRGRGIATAMMNYIFDEARKIGKKRVYLTVNKHNDHAIDVYKKIGFAAVDTVVTDIGGGYVMDDFIMEYQIKE
ncbi:MAG: GNAT family N-acetyltransferase [Ruminococcus sp.]|nr:GNAT family N-acetyltransferase [Ruminococcus sp.]